MTEEEANSLIEEVNAEIEDAIRAWGVHGASNSPGGIHQVFTRETEGVAGSGEVLPNATNLSGIVGLAAATVYELRFRESSGAEYAVPAPFTQPRFDATVTRFAPFPVFGVGGLDFIRNPNGSMRVYVNDPWATIGGVNAAVVSNPASIGGGRPYLTVPNDGSQYSIFKTATCSRQVYLAEPGEMPVPDVMSATFFECSLRERASSSEWMPHTTYDYVAGTTDPEVYSGDIVSLVSSFGVCMGFRNVNIAPEGSPVQVTSCFIVSEQTQVGVPSVFSWSPEDNTEYAEKVYTASELLFNRNNIVPLVGVSAAIAPIYPCP